MPMTPPVVIFSDLDGTLLDPATGSAEAAADALAMIAHARVPLVFCSSKTRAEILVVQQELGIQQPFIAENGGALYIPEGYFDFEVPWGRPSPSGFVVVQYGRPYGEVVDKLCHAARRARIPVVGFNDMSVDDVARECGLPLLSARLAKLREFSEPFRMADNSPSTRRRLENALNAEGLACSAGTLFDLAGVHKDQGLPVRMLITLYRRAMGRAHTVGLGDAADDLPLLRRVDQPVVVGNNDGRSIPLLESLPRALGTRLTGPAGWAERVEAIVGEAIGRSTSLVGFSSERRR